MYLIEKRWIIPMTNKINDESISPIDSILNPHPLMGMDPVVAAFQPMDKNPMKINHTPIVGILAQMKRFEKQSPAAMIAGIMDNAK